MKKPYKFSEDNIGNAPDAPGVYALLINGEIVYYGSSEVSIRSRLQDHQSGNEGPTSGATTYMREECDNPVERERQLLLEFKRRHGKLPRYNKTIP